MIVLGIESSCDDTSVALVDCSDEGFFVLSEKTASQIAVHKKYGGVVPEVAGRMHAENILPVIEKVLNHKNIKTLKHKNKPFVPDAIAVTAGPGLVTGLVVGVEAAKTLSYLWDVPLVAVNHIAGHAHSVQIGNRTSAIRSLIADSQIQYPALSLIVSGGHTELLLMSDPTTFELIGKTRDDAAGECFDKVGKLLGFDYPGGPKISQFAANGDPRAIQFPRPMLNEEMNFSAKGGPAFGWSFAGLKTAALYWLRDNATNKPKTYHLKPKTLKDFCASFEQAIVDVLVAKTLRAAKGYSPQTIILGGGVSANQKLRSVLTETMHEWSPKSEVRSPKSEYAMDNGAMIAVAGYYLAKKRQFTRWPDIEVDPNWKVY